VKGGIRFVVQGSSFFRLPGRSQSAVPHNTTVTMSASRNEDGKEEEQAFRHETNSRAFEGGGDRIPALQPPAADEEDADAGDAATTGASAVEATESTQRGTPSAMGPEARQQRPTIATATTSAASAASATTTTVHSSSTNGQSMTRALFFSWMLPVFILAVISRFTVNLEPDPDLAPAASAAHKPGRPVSLQLDGAAGGSRTQHTKKQKQRDSGTPSLPSAAPSMLPTNYLALVDTIDKRRRRVGRFAAAPPSYSSSTGSGGRAAASGSSKPKVDHGAAEQNGRGRRGQGALNDPDRARFRKRLAELQGRHDDDPADFFLALELADAYRMYEVQYHDGGSHEADALRMYEVVTDRVERLRSEAIERGQPTAIPDDGRDVSDEMMLPYPQRSLDGLLCAVYSGQGKALYMANMFAKSVDSYSRCIEVVPEYLDAIDARASSYIVLGMYEEAARDYRVVIERDENQLLFPQSYTGMARVLEVRENATDGGWGFVVDRLAAVIPTLEARHDTYPQGRQVLAPALNRLHHVVRYQ
jgi:tetratricopeptide (TPR) repeat protein